MQLTIKQKYKLKQFIGSTILGILLGFLYALVEDGWQRFPLINGTLAGFLIGASVSILELYLFGGSLRRIPFISIFLLRLFIYFILTFAITFTLFLSSRTIKYGLSQSEVLQSEEFQTYLSNEYQLVLAFSFLVITIVVFTMQMARKMGYSDLLAFITGKYRTPKKEKRIFMFISLGSSDSIINKIGNHEFHNFINDFIFDISSTIHIHGGEIVHYMEDTVVITWTMDIGAHNANCIRTYFDLCHEIGWNFEYYHSKYSVLPQPKCAVHAGNVIKAEIGVIKSEICFFGDVVNTTSRILYEGVKQGVDILISQPVMERIKLPVNYQVSDYGSHTFRGKYKPVQLYSIHLSNDE